MIELKGKLLTQPRAYQQLLLLNPAHIVAIYAPFASRNCGCRVLTSAGVEYEVENAYDDVKRLLD